MSQDIISAVCVVEGGVLKTIAFDSETSAKLFCGGFNLAGREYSNEGPTCAVTRETFSKHFELEEGDALTIEVAGLLGIGEETKNMSKPFLVGIREVHVSTRRVLAEDAEEALLLCMEGEEVMCEYSHTLDADTFTVEEEKTSDTEE